MKARPVALPAAPFPSNPPLTGASLARCSRDGDCERAAQMRSANDTGATRQHTQRSPGVCGCPAWPAGRWLALACGWLSCGTCMHARGVEGNAEGLWVDGELATGHRESLCTTYRCTACEVFTLREGYCVFRASPRWPALLPCGAFRCDRLSCGSGHGGNVRVFTCSSRTSSFCVLLSMGMRYSDTRRFGIHYLLVAGDTMPHKFHVMDEGGGECAFRLAFRVNPDSLAHLV